MSAQMPAFAVTEVAWRREGKSTLPMLGVECRARKDGETCGGKFLVTLDWPTSSPFQTRPCPYCFMTSRIPEELLT